MTFPTATTTCEEIDAIALAVLVGDVPRAESDPLYVMVNDRLTLTRGIAERAANQWLTRSAAVRAGWRTVCPLDDFAREALGGSR